MIVKFITIIITKLVLFVKIVTIGCSGETKNLPLLSTGGLVLTIGSFLPPEILRERQ